MIRVAGPEDVDDLIDVNIRTWASTYQGIVDDELLVSMTPASLREMDGPILMLFNDQGVTNAFSVCY